MEKSNNEQTETTQSPKEVLEFYKKEKKELNQRIQELLQTKERLDNLMIEMTEGIISV